ncbi:Uncharacterised protein [uncultured archaeon]|nr:Uncharacterised protein [uncultured archaeon]
MGLKKILLFMGLACLLAQLFFSGAAAKDGSATLNLIIRMEESSLAGGKNQAEKQNQEMNSTINLLNAVDSKNLDVTISVTGDMAYKLYPLYVTMLGSKKNHELIMSGMKSGEELASFEDQDSRMRKTKRYVEDDYICGGTQIKVAGYLPAENSFNDSTYKIIDDLGLSYMVDDSGLAQSQDKAWPYLMDGHSFYVVPASAGPNFRMWDVLANSAGLNGTDWYDLLVSTFDESSAKGDPMVAVFTNTVSGSGEYLDAYKKFVEYAVSKGASFVTTGQLVDTAKSK